MKDQWFALDDYFNEHLLGADPDLEAALQANSAADLPAIDVSAAQGKMLYLLARMQGANRILEIGTLGGYSTICMARALPNDGQIVSLELEEKHARVARANLERAGLLPLVDIRVGKALETLAQLHRENAGPFDFTFIDADKENIPQYFQWAIKLGRPSSAIVVDNVGRRGEVIDADTDDRGTLGVRRLMEMLKGESRISATTIQTVGHKGYDGFLLAICQ